MGTASDHDSLGRLPGSNGLSEGAGELERELVRERLFGFGNVPMLGERYEIGRRIGRGGMGDVYAATDTKLDRQVAVKVLSQDASADEKAKARLVREALIMARVSSVHVVPVFDVGTTGRTGAIMGTPAYMAPELFEGMPSGQKSDQFALGVTLFEALYGLRPFAGKSWQQCRDAAQRGVVVGAPRERGVPRWVHAIALRTLEADPDRRFETVAELVSALSREPTSRQRVWRWTAGGSLLLAGGVGGLFAWQQYERQSCAGEADRLHGIWDEQRKADVRGALMQTGRPYAATTWSIVEETIDGYSQRWVESHVDACTKTHVWRQQSEELMELRLACLGDRLEAVRSLVDVFAAADDEVLDNAAGAVQNLPRLDRCGDAGWLRARTKPPEGEAAAAAVASLRAGLADAQALLAAGKFAEGLEEARRLTLLAREIGHAPAVAEAVLVEGKLAERVGDYDLAEQSLRESFFSARRLQMQEATVEAASSLVGVFMSGANYEAALEWGEHADAEIALLPNSDAAQGDLLVRIAQVHSGRGDHDRALADNRRAFALYEAAVGPENAARGAVLHNIGSTLMALGRYDEARTYLQRSRSMYEKTLGSDHPRIAEPVHAMAVLAFNRGEYKEARAGFEEVVAIEERAHGPDFPKLALALAALGNLARREGKYAQSHRYLERALALTKAAHGPDHPRVAHTLSSIGTVLAWEEKHAEALEHFTQAVAIGEAALGPEHADVGRWVNNVGRSLEELGRPAAALVQYRRALAIKQKALGEDHPVVASSLRNIGMILRDQGEYAEALEHFRRSLAITESASGPEHPELAQTLVDIASASLSIGETKDAQAAYRRAIAIASVAEPSPGLLAQARFGLAQLVDRDEGRALAVAARADYEAVPEEDQSEHIAKIEAWLHAHP